MVIDFIIGLAAIIICDRLVKYDAVGCRESVVIHHSKWYASITPLLIFLNSSACLSLGAVDRSVSFGGNSRSPREEKSMPLSVPFVFWIERPWSRTRTQLFRRHLSLSDGCYFCFGPYRLSVPIEMYVLDLVLGDTMDISPKSESVRRSRSSKIQVESKNSFILGVCTS